MADEEGRYPRPKARPLRTAPAGLVFSSRRKVARPLGSRTKWCERCGHKVHQCICPKQP